MGSAISSPARKVVANSALRDVARMQPKSNIENIQHASKQTSTHDPHVTARLRQTPPEYSRKTNEEWSETLKKISGAISSSSWEGEMRTHIHNQAKTERHSAQRSNETNTRLPRQHFGEDGQDQHGVLMRPAGRLSQNQILQMFNLRRTDPKKWDVADIAKKYGLEEEDVANLLSFSRTYAARIDKDGQVRGYYNTNPENTISRFEKD